MTIAPLKVSYCTTCRGRLPHLRETLPANMEAERKNPNVEFVVLDYGDEGKDGDIGAWIKETFPNELASGRLRYARFEAPNFEMAHSRNMAHRLATGDVVCNVDADNFIRPNFSRWLNKQFIQQPDGVVHNIALDPVQFTKRAASMLLKREVIHSNMGGRVAMMRQTFEVLGGYDERYSAHGGCDKNLAMRAAAMQLPAMRLPKDQWGSFIPHSNEARVENLSEADRAAAEGRLGSSMAKKYLNGMKFAQTKFDPVANPVGEVGCGEVRINFADEPTVIEPLNLKTPWSEAQAAAVQTAEKTDIAAEREPEAARRTDWAKSLKPQAHPQIGSKTR